MKNIKKYVSKQKSQPTSRRSLAAFTSNAFESAVRERGERYYYEHTVTIQHGSSKSVVAKVRGTRSYNVSLELCDDELAVDCNCPYFVDEGLFCKHLWAAILASDTENYIVPPSNCTELLVVDNSVDADVSEVAETDMREATHDAIEENNENEDEDEDGDGDEDIRHAASSVQANVIHLKDYIDSKTQSYSETKTSSKNTAPSLPQEHWQKVLESMGRIDTLLHSQRFHPRNPFANTELSYALNLPETLKGEGLVVEILLRKPNRDGSWGDPKEKYIAPSDIPSLPNPSDQEILTILNNAQNLRTDSDRYDTQRQSRYRIDYNFDEIILPLLLRTGRCLLRKQLNGPLTPLHLNEAELPWEFQLEIRKDTASEYLVRGYLYRESKRNDLCEPLILTKGGWILWTDRFSRLSDKNNFPWISILRREKEFRVPIQQGNTLIEKLCSSTHIPKLDLPQELQFEKIQGTPRPQLKIKKSENSYRDDKVCGQLSFNYSGKVLSAKHTAAHVFLPEQRQLILRNPQAEREASAKLTRLGFRNNTYYRDQPPELSVNKLPAVVRALIAENWLVEAEGKLYRSSGNFDISVKSGIDWFELHGSVNFEGASVSFPTLLAALKKGEDVVRLDDGSFGLLPEEWLKKLGLLTGTGTLHGDHLRFTTPQAGILDALLATQPNAQCDATFAHVREELRSFDKIQPLMPPDTFVGKLRPYQKEGLGWLNFLQRFGFGGCLADDMGLGKTIQVLALLDSRRAQQSTQSPKRSAALLPSLVVVPRSLIFNWRHEANTFAPKLRILDHTGAGRAKATQESFANYDLILTTYGTMRSDIIHLKDIRFDYVILDEAQAIKNTSTASAKAVRLLQGRYRLCMSGTPIENHLGELWSLFEFLNPGMLGAASIFQMRATDVRIPSDETRTLLSRALRPFILRRTKQQVAKDLPLKTEQTLFCVMDTEQRKAYDELREHYRKALLTRIEKEGVNKSKIQILEALLRLRQAACHPGLIDKSKISAGSAKLDALLPQLIEVLSEGHKALVFSQFTSLLAIVRKKLDSEKIVYEYLDGKTRDRESKVNRFQNDPDCKLFLISLKAGGLGLNLTAAEYVFLLDPWWNPAVEAQAIDRAHRIGQTRPVFAYRLIAQDTVEEKVLKLQDTKRALADAIINADNSLIRSLTREDLELLLG